MRATVDVEQASMQCSTMLGMLISICTHQRNNAKKHQYTVDILCKAASFAAKEENIHGQMIFSVFLAGVHSLYSRDRNRALRIMRWLESHGVYCYASETRKLLEAVNPEQKSRADFGKSAADFGWVSFGQAQNIHIINFGV